MLRPDPSTREARARLRALIASGRTVVRAVAIPVIAGAEGGFNASANMWLTVQAFEQAGAAAIHIEDHMGPGKHTDLPRALRPLEEAAARIRAAAEAREDPDFLVAARSDASWIGLGFEETLRRLEAYARAGADLVFPTLVSAGASLVLYCGFSALVQFDALGRALERFKATRDAGAVPGYRASVRAFEDFMGYREFAERARHHCK